MRYIKPLFFSLSLMLASVLMPATSQAATTESAPQLPTQLLRLGNSTLEVEIAATNQSRQRGLMHRHVMAEERGMLFVFEQAERLCFWMRNTYIPLSIAYLDKDATIIEIFDMQALDERSVCSTAPAQFALEVNQGWFERHQIQVGQRVEGIVP
ncbi:DUF192 domain-containing protein [Oligella sp. HMSC09E12]|uniref:DUF192 domain-containing protein n=1 Tax=Oligella sp. HMSC09E12 TaxID=1581147 RepID=UPI0008A555D4|nr:DUF192 domain-containing protein [Oligella sp. HMSC09E12]OFV50976.1 hypothetical protein HMPREF3179_01730 [Oligella sp. HMSC09E12]